MATFSFITDLFEYIVLVISVVAILWGFDRFIKPDSREMDIVRWIAFSFGILGLIVVSLLLLDQRDEIYSGLVLLTILLSLLLTARLVQKYPIAISAVMLAGIAGLFFFALTWTAISILAIPLWILALVLLVILLCVFISAYVAESIFDKFLNIVSWSPFIVVVGVITFFFAITNIIAL